MAMVWSGRSRASCSRTFATIAGDANCSRLFVCFLLLQLRQQVTRLSESWHSISRPRQVFRRVGSTWSRVRSSQDPQYTHARLSLEYICHLLSTAIHLLPFLCVIWLSFECWVLSVECFDLSWSHQFTDNRWRHKLRSACPFHHYKIVVLVYTFIDINEI